MGLVLVTGGTGNLGSHLVATLLERDHQVRVISRQANPRCAPGVETVQGDVRSGEGLERAVVGVDTVVHTASMPFGRHTLAIEVDGTTNMLHAARSVGAHFIYMSIVGVNGHRFPYYRAKWQAEQAVMASTPTGRAEDWTIQRATQFHSLIDGLLGAPLTPTTKYLKFQTVDVGDVAERLAEVVDAGPMGRAEDFGGPEVRSLRGLAASRRRITGKRSRFVPVPRIGFMRDYDAGFHLAPGHRDGSVTWEQWLEGQAARKHTDRAVIPTLPI